MQILIFTSNHDENAFCAIVGKVQHAPHVDASLEMGASDSVVENSFGGVVKDNHSADCRYLVIARVRRRCSGENIAFTSTVGDQARARSSHEIPQRVG